MCNILNRNLYLIYNHVLWLLSNFITFTIIYSFSQSPSTWRRAHTHFHNHLQLEDVPTSSVCDVNQKHVKMTFTINFNIKRICFFPSQLQRGFGCSKNTHTLNLQRVLRCQKYPQDFTYVKLGLRSPKSTHWIWINM